MRMRSGLLMAALIGIATLTILLTLESARSGREHQRTAHQVLLDYAGLGAEGVAGRLQPMLAGRLFQILTALRESPITGRDQLHNATGPATAPLVDGIRWVGQLPGNGPLRSVAFDSSPGPSADLSSSIRSASAALPELAYFGMLIDRGEVVVFAPARSSPGTTPAFGMPLPVLAALLEEFLAHDPILPRTLTRGDSLGPGLQATVAMPGHHLATRGQRDSTPFRTTRQLGPLFGGMTVEVSLAEVLAPALLIGGVPASRLPFLAVALALTVTLAAIGIVQLRQAERLARLQQEFVAGTSHELRTPLAQIRLFAETLRLGRTRSDTERAHALTVVEREARRLEHLVENLLHVARPGQSRPPLAIATHDLGQLTATVVDDLTPLADKAGITIVVERTDRSPAAVDAGAWRQITTNLIDNAIKYGGRGTRISVRVEAGAGVHRLVVADEGPGIPASDRARIWERFWRGDDPLTRGTSGTGIGLATVRDLVGMHAGECAVEPNQPRGTRFVIRLPAAP